MRDIKFRAWDNLEKYYDMSANYVYAVADDPIGTWGVGDEFLELR